MDLDAHSFWMYTQHSYLVFRYVLFCFLFIFFFLFLEFSRSWFDSRQRTEPQPNVRMQIIHHAMTTTATSKIHIADNRRTLPLHFTRNSQPALRWGNTKHISYHFRSIDRQPLDRRRRTIARPDRERRSRNGLIFDWVRWWFLFKLVNSEELINIQSNPMNLIGILFAQIFVKQKQQQSAALLCSSCDWALFVDGIASQ